VEAFARKINGVENGDGINEVFDGFIDTLIRSPLIKIDKEIVDLLLKCITKGRE